MQLKRFSLATVLGLAAMAAAADFDIRNYGARTGETCTASIQKALDAADAAGGGRVVVPVGRGRAARSGSVRAWSCT